jgi:serine/threonine protein kinase
MEYANSGTLQEYLKNHFNTLTWNDKFDMALQLSHAVLCLHDEGIVHRDLVINFNFIILYCIMYVNLLINLIICYCIINRTLKMY